MPLASFEELVEKELQKTPDQPRVLAAMTVGTRTIGIFLQMFREKVAEAAQEPTVRKIQELIQTLDDSSNNLYETLEHIHNRVSDALETLNQYPNRNQQYIVFFPKSVDDSLLSFATFYLSRGTPVTVEIDFDKREDARPVTKKNFIKDLFSGFSVRFPENQDMSGTADADDPSHDQNASEFCNKFRVTIFSLRGIEKLKAAIAATVKANSGHTLISFSVAGQ